MTFNYSNLEALALNQIADKGRNVTLRYVAEGTYAPSTDTISGASTSDATVKAFIRNYTQRELIDGIVLKGDKEALIASSGITAPEMNDIIVDGDEYRIIQVEEVKPGDTSLIYRLQLRR